MRVLLIREEIHRTLAARKECLAALIGARYVARGAADDG